LKEVSRNYKLPQISIVRYWSLLSNAVFLRSRFRKSIKISFTNAKSPTQAGDKRHQESTTSPAKKEKLLDICRFRRLDVARTLYRIADIYGLVNRMPNVYLWSVVRWTNSHVGIWCRERPTTQTKDDFVGTVAL